MPYLIIRSINPGTANVYGDPSLVGHAWVEIVDSTNSPTGSAESYGYYPEIHSPSYPGEVRQTDRTDYYGIGDSKQYPISEEQAQKVRDHAEIADKGWRDYRGQRHLVF